MFASVENADVIELRHCARAQAITARWREGLHALLAQLGEQGVSQEYEKEERLYEAFCRHGQMTPAEAARYVKGMSSAEATHLISSMLLCGRLQMGDKTKMGTVRYVAV